MAAMDRAVDWLAAKCALRNWPVYVERNGRIELVAWVYKMKRTDKCSVWYLQSGVPAQSIKRFCL